MVTLKLIKAGPGCAKPGCNRRPVDRHHKGCERMWLRHFRHKRDQQKFKDFRNRYYEFQDEDCVPLCRWHHQEIHEVYLKLISDEAWLNGACIAWTWRQAEALMKKLRAVCDTWLQVETPGVEPKRRHIG